MDIAGQAISVWLRRWWVLSGAALAALAVFATGTATPPTYSAVLTARVDVHNADGTDFGQTVTFVTQTVVGLAGTPAVQAEAAARSGLAVSVDDVAARTTVNQTKAPGLVAIEATARGPAEAVRLAQAMNDALADRLAKDAVSSATAAAAPLEDQIAQLTKQLNALSAKETPERTALQRRYDALTAAVTDIQSRPAPALIAETPAAVPATPISPTPVRNAGLTFLVALILLGEGVVVVRAARGRLSESNTAAQVAGAVGLPAVVVNAAGSPITTLAVFYRQWLKGAPSVTVLHLAKRRPAVDVGAVLARSAGFVGDEATHIDLHPDPQRSTGPLPALVEKGRIVRTLWRPRVDTYGLRLLGMLRGPILIVVDTATTNVRDLVSSVATLRAANVEVVGVLVWRGRIPRARYAFPVPRRVPSALPRLAENTK